MVQPAEKKGGLANAIILVLVLILGFFLIPGVLFVWVFKQISEINLAIAQMWTFAAVFSFALLSLIAVIRKSIFKGLFTYLCICLFILIVALVSHFGFEAQWPIIIIEEFLSEETVEKIRGHTLN